MKVIIISDVTEAVNSIIPYGLNIAKFAETTVEIVHLIDPREEQASYSPYSDSHTVSPGEKLNHDQKIQRAKSRAHTMLDRLLSREGSRLNYPLRIRQTIEVELVEPALQEKLAAEPGSLLVSGTSPAHSMVANLGELMMILQEVENPLLLLPPDQKFLPPRQGVLITDFTSQETQSIANVMPWLKPFDTELHALAIAPESKAGEMQEKSRHFAEHPGMITQTGIISGEDTVKTLVRYVHENKPDVVILPKNKKAFAEYLYAGENAVHLLEAIGKPIFLY